MFLTDDDLCIYMPYPTKNNRQCPAYLTEWISWLASRLESNTGVKVIPHPVSIVTVDKLNALIEYVGKTDEVCYDLFLIANSKRTLVYGTKPLAGMDIDELIFVKSKLTAIKKLAVAFLFK